MKFDPAKIDTLTMHFVILYVVVLASLAIGFDNGAAISDLRAALQDAEVIPVATITERAPGQ